LTETATLVAVDLPGFGGSDSLPNYDPDSVLEALSEFIMKMRETYLSESPGPVVIVGHDWGALIGFRLASEASVLADRFILSNTFLVSIFGLVIIFTINRLLASTRSRQH
jgi:pimeloyl-ACP methyl ester carboxylesterase